MSRKKYDANLPRNLTYRKASKSFFWRNPVTDKEFPLGQIARRDAITQAIEANNFIAQNHTPVALIEKLIDRCRLVSRTDFMISAGIRKNSPTGNIHPDGLTKTFVKARKASGVNFSNNPPTFHEIRSLAGRLYKNEHGEVFAQKLLGHTSANTTKLYLDERDDKAYMML
ncbi:TPA: phage integrase Arm DNA-binding domain-containing protein [Salmonella enterica subsp. enterica serovar Wangata]|nr:hypothetical protein [Salmonella enterica subsp. enterica serovar Wangata]ECB6786838.1 hypothetical protein [Salmonella enterica subsp. enterica serovar Wangata]EFT9514909.1 tyrosine-type recombinase/integrase [Salmonella enterica subsp. enterica serovar Wangata]HBJ6740733.1 phage integrase Arm DNA-binding domain-containing protein [Salmonella enterica subsp. enterica serovar Wangata]